MKKLIICTILTLGFTNLNALPSGEDTTFAGNTTVSIEGNTMTVTQDTNYKNSIIEWESFNIDGVETFKVIQENDTYTLLNRVTGLSQSMISGTIEANGSVWIINQNGIAFGEGAVIDVYGFLASTLDIGDENFQIDQNYIFDSTEENTVVNNGSIISKGIAGYVVLAGHQVVNNGYISARFGKVVLGAGTQMTVAFTNDGLLNFVFNTNSPEATNSVTNEGIIDISSQIVAPDLADNTLTDLVANRNAIASNVTQAGDVLIFGRTANINGKIFANGSQEGEDIVDGGDIIIDVGADEWSYGLTLGTDSLIEAVSENGTSGSVVISSQGNNDLRGNINLSTKSGNAGTLEVDSDGFLLVVGSKIDLSSTDGVSGNVNFTSKNNFNFNDSTIFAKTITITVNGGDGFLTINNNSLLQGQDISLNGIYVNVLNNSNVNGDNILLSVPNIYQNGNIYLSGDSTITGKSVSIEGINLNLEGDIHGEDNIDIYSPNTIYAYGGTKSGGDIVWNSDQNVVDYSIINADSVEYIAQKHVTLGQINAPIILLDTPEVYSLDIDLQKTTVVIGNSEKQTQLLPQMGSELFTVIGNTKFPLVFVDILPKGLPNIIEFFNIFDQTKETVPQESESSNKSIPNLITIDPEVLPNDYNSGQVQFYP